MLQYAKDAAENFRPRPGRCGLIWGGLQTKRGLEPLRWGENIGVEVTGKQGSGKSRGFVMPSLLIEDVHEDAARWTTEQRRFHPYGYETVKIVLDNDATGAQTEKHQTRMMGEINKLTAGSDGKLDAADYARTVKTLLTGGSDPVISKEPVGAFTNVVIEKAMAK